MTGEAGGAAVQLPGGGGLVQLHAFGFAVQHQLQKGFRGSLGSGVVRLGQHRQAGAVIVALPVAVVAPVADDGAVLQRLNAQRGAVAAPIEGPDHAELLLVHVAVEVGVGFGIEIKGILYGLRDLGQSCVYGLRRGHGGETEP